MTRSLLSPLLALLDSLRYAALRGRRRSERSLGRRGEDLAHRYLQKRGYRILARNAYGDSVWVSLDAVSITTP